MNDKVFLDSNILIYTYSNSEIPKQDIARKIIEESNSFISTQVLQELVNIITRKFKFNYSDAITAVLECCKNNNLYVNTDHIIIKACGIGDRYGFSFYDCLIVASAIECGCSILYSEDFQNNQLIDEKLKIINPFGELNK